MVEFHAEFVMAAADVLDECVSGADHASRAELFETTHRPESGLVVPGHGKSDLIFGAANRSAIGTVVERTGR